MSNSKTSTKKLEKIAAYLEYACYLCGNILSSPSQTINHVRKIHGRQLPNRKVGIKRPQSKKYTYVRDKKGKYTIHEQACPSCWFHCPENDLEYLYEHTLEEHKPEKVDPASGAIVISDEEDDNEGYATDTSAVSGRSGRSIRSIRSISATKSSSSGPSQSSLDRFANGGGDSDGMGYFSEKAPTPSAKNNSLRHRRSVSFEKTADDTEEEFSTAAEITRRLEEITKLFKSMLGTA